MSLKWYGDKAKKDIELASNRFLHRAVNLVQGVAVLTLRENGNIDTGNLVGSIDTAVYQNKGEVFTNVEYAPYIEFGTGRFAENGDGRQTGWYYEDSKGIGHFTLGYKPHPFLRPALNDNKDKIKKIAEQELIKIWR